MESVTLAFVKTKEILSHLNAAKFFAAYLPHIKNYKHKMREIDGNKKPIDFSDEEKKQIIDAVKKFAKDVSKKPVKEREPKGKKP